MPYCFRSLIPALLGTSPVVWLWATRVALVAQGVLIALICQDVRATLLLLALPAGARFSLRCPLLVDAVAMAFVLLASWAVLSGVVPSWALPAVLPAVLLCLGIMRETAPLWLGAYTWNVDVWLWMPVTALALFLGWEFKRRPAEFRDSVFIQRPLKACMERRRGHWFDWSTMLLPWGVLLPLALMAQWEYTLLIYLAASLPLLVVTDTARIHYWAAPALIPVALQAPIPDALWPVLVAAHLFNPYRGA